MIYFLIMGNSANIKRIAMLHHAGKQNFKNYKLTLASEEIN